jgi:hypothetical protein
MGCLLIINALGNRYFLTTVLFITFKKLIKMRVLFIFLSFLFILPCSAETTEVCVIAREQGLSMPEQFFHSKPKKRKKKRKHSKKQGSIKKKRGSKKNKSRSHSAVYRRKGNGIL